MRTLKRERERARESKQGQIQGVPVAFYRNFAFYGEILLGHPVEVAVLVDGSVVVERAARV